MLAKKLHSVLRLVVLTALSAAVLFSCVFDRNTDDDKVNVPLAEQLSFYDARLFFDEYEQGLALGPSAGHGTRSLPSGGYSISWDNACYSMLFDGEIIEVPFDGIAFFISSSTDGGDANVASPASGPNTAVKLIAGIDRWGEIYYRLVYITPDPAWLASRGLDLLSMPLESMEDNYTGQIRLLRPDGTFHSGYEYVSGEVRLVYFPASPPPSGTSSVAHDHDHAHGDECPVCAFGTDGEGREGFGDHGEAPGGTRSSVTRAQDNCYVTIECWFWIYSDGTIEIITCDAYLVGCAGGAGGGGGSDPGGGGLGKPSICPACKRNPCRCIPEILDPACTVCKKNPCICVESEDPCASMKQKTGNQEFKDKLDNLKSWTGADNTRETAYTYTLGPDGSYNFSQRLTSEINNPIINMGASNQPEWDGMMHSHYPGCGNIFSLGDLMTPFQSHVAGRLRNLRSFSSGLVTPDGILFFVIDDIAAYMAFAGPALTNQYHYNTLLNQFHEDYNINADASMNDALGNLLQFLEDNNTGLTVFKMGEDYEFEKQSLDEDGTVNSDDCDD